MVWVVHRRGQSFCSKRKVRPNQAALQLHTRRAAAAAADAADAAATAALQEGVEQQNNSAGAGTGFSGPIVKADTSAAPQGSWDNNADDEVEKVGRMCFARLLSN